MIIYPEITNNGEKKKACERTTKLPSAISVVLPRRGFFSLLPTFLHDYNARGVAFFKESACDRTYFFSFIIIFFFIESVVVRNLTARGRNKFRCLSVDSYSNDSVKLGETIVNIFLLDRTCPRRRYFIADKPYVVAGIPKRKTNRCRAGEIKRNGNRIGNSIRKNEKKNY